MVTLSFPEEFVSPIIGSSVQTIGYGKKKSVISRGLITDLVFYGVVTLPLSTLILAAEKNSPYEDDNKANKVVNGAKASHFLVRE